MSSFVTFVKGMLSRYNCTFLGIDALGVGAGVYQLLAKPDAGIKGVTKIEYSLEVKAMMIMKAQNVISRGRMVAMIERVDHDGYAEPFVGMGGIFLRRRSRPKVEVINDVSGDVVTFFRVLQRHYPYMLDMLRFRVAARVEFERLKATPPETLTDLERACRFLYLQRLAFGGKVNGRHFGVDKTPGARFNVAKLEPMLADIHERLAGVVIEQLGYADFIRRYDREGMLFYLDPPYWGCEEDYGQDVFGRADFDQLAAQLAGIKGKFLLSINDTPGVRKAFAAFPMSDAATTYTVGAGAAVKAAELIISNFIPS